MKRTLSFIMITVGILLSASGILLKTAPVFLHLHKTRTAAAVIGSSDGPTSIFIAGRIGPDLSLVCIIAGAVTVLLGLILRKK